MKKEPVFLAIVRSIDDSKRRQGGNSDLTSAKPMSHGLTEKVKREHMTAVGTKNSFLTVENRKEAVFQKVKSEHQDTLRSLVAKYKEVFTDRLPKGHPPKREVENHVKIVPGTEPPSR